MRKRSKYRPRPVLQNTIAYVLESIRPIAQHGNPLINARIQNSQAMVELLKGRANTNDMITLAEMSNMVEALCHLGFGKQYEEIARKGREAISSIAIKASSRGRYVPSGEQIKALQELIDLHDAQMEVATVKDIGQAVLFIKQEVRQKRATNLPTIRV